MSWVIDAFKEIIPRGKKKMDKIEVPKQPLATPPVATPEKVAAVRAQIAKEQTQQPQEPAPQEIEGGQGQQEVSFEKLLIDLYNNVAAMQEDIKDIKTFVRVLIERK